MYFYYCVYINIIIWIVIFCFNNIQILDFLIMMCILVCIVTHEHPVLSTDQTTACTQSKCAFLHQARSDISMWLMHENMRSACLCTLHPVKHTPHTHTYCTYTHTSPHISLHGRLAAHKSHPPKRISRNNLSREGFYFIICQPRFVPAACTDPCSDKFACHLSWAAGIWACVIM